MTTHVVEVTRYYGDREGRSIVYRGTEWQCQLYADAKNRDYQSDQWVVRAWVPESEYRSGGMTWEEIAGG